MGTGIFDNDTLYLANDQSLAADFITPRHETRYHDMGAVQIWWDNSDATTGTFIVQFSLDDIHYTDSVAAIDAGTVCALSGSNYFEFTDITCNYWRVKYTANTVTAGTVTIFSSLKRRR